MEVDALARKLGQIVFHHGGVNALGRNFARHHAGGSRVLFKHVHLVAQARQHGRAAKARGAGAHHGGLFAAGGGQLGRVGRVGAGKLLQIANVNGRAAVVHGAVFLAQVFAGAQRAANAAQRVCRFNHALGAFHIGIAQMADKLRHVHPGGAALLAGGVHAIQAAPGLGLHFSHGLLDLSHISRLLYLCCIVMQPTGQICVHRPQPSHLSLSTMALRFSSRWMALYALSAHTATQRPQPTHFSGSACEYSL